MDFKIFYWHWLVFGMMLIIAEIFIPSFSLLWFGLGAIIMGVLLLLMPKLALSWQLFVWVASSLFTFIWFKFIKPRMTDQTKTGITKEAVLRESGQVIELPVEGKRGMVRFSKPIRGLMNGLLFVREKSFAEIESL
ncbi:MAG: NfeD family protein [Thermodesulfobacteriota bacterium]|nr:NfeD family protein [Thermodesulfobacteriota bacterium]